MNKFGTALAAGVAFAFASPAAAHVALRYPPSRYGDYILKIGPCGMAGGTRSSHVTMLEPGASITVTWNEYVNHPGHFRIAFDVDGDDDFVDPLCLNGCNTMSPQIELYSNPAVLLDGIPDTPHGGDSGAQITLPDVECDRCTLQLIQVMYDKPPYVTPGNDIYYQCADLVLQRGVFTPTATSSPTSTALPPSRTPTATPSRTPTPPPPTPTETATRKPTVQRLTPIPTATSTRTPTVRRSTPVPTEKRSPTPTASPPPPTVGCGAAGDCDGSGTVSSGDLMTMVEIIFDDADRSACPPADADGDGTIRVNDIVGTMLPDLRRCTPP